jgi:hypothetical protein
MLPLLALAGIQASTLAAAGAVIAGIGAVAGLGVGIASAVKGSKASDKMEAQAEANRDLYNKQASYKQNIYDTYTRPETILKQKLETDALRGGFADSGLIASSGTPILALYYAKKRQQMQLMSADEQVKNDVYITRLQGENAYQQGKLQADMTQMNAIFGGVNSGLNALGSFSQFMK